MNPFSASKCTIRLSVALAGMGILCLAAGCGSSVSLPQRLGGNFSPASMKGQFVISQTGVGITQAGNSVAPFSETIVFTADGNKNINVTVDDFDQIGGPFFLNSPVAGTYSINSDGTGTIAFNGSNYTITMIDDNHFYIIEQDLFATASGFGEKQDTTAFAAAPSGKFVFKAHEVDTTSRVGGITITSGAISGTEDFLNLGVTSVSNPVSTAAAMSVPDANGRGAFTLTDGTSFNYYVVNSSKFYLMSNSLSGSLEIGQAEAQSAGPFSVATLANNTSYVFGSAGDTTTMGSAAIHSAGVFSTDGNGNITSGGSVDFVQDTTVNSNLAVTGGSYALASNGRGQVNLTLSGGVINPQVFWMVSGTRAYFLVDSASAVEDGTFTLQSGAPFSSVGAQAAFVMDGFDAGGFKDRVGAFQPTSGNNFKWNQAANSFNDSVFPPAATLSSVGTNGTFQVGSNGRVAVVVNSNVSNSLVFYLSSASSGVMVQEDADVGGAFSTQASQ